LTQTELTELVEENYVDEPAIEVREFDDEAFWNSADDN
jgi:hypothetical protein